jgi:hypothetical protein
MSRAVEQKNIAHMGFLNVSKLINCSNPREREFLQGGFCIGRKSFYAYRKINVFIPMTKHNDNVALHHRHIPYIQQGNLLLQHAALLEHRFPHVKFSN